MNYEQHQREMLAHCVRLAQIDKAYAWWAARRYARESEGVLADLPQLLTDEMQRRKETMDKTDDATKLPQKGEGVLPQQGVNLDLADDTPLLCPVDRDPGEECEVCQ